MRSSIFACAGSRIAAFAAFGMTGGGAGRRGAKDVKERVCVRAGMARGGKPGMLHGERGGPGPHTCLVGSSHRRPTQTQAPIIHLPRIASLPGAHRHFRASDR